MGALTQIRVLGGTIALAIRSVPVACPETYHLTVL